MTVEIWESVTWSLDNSSYCYVDAESGRRVDKKTKKFLDALVEYASEDRELINGLDAAMEEGAQLFYRNEAVDKPTLNKAKRAILLDASTANIMSQVFAAINDKNKEHIRSLSFEKAALTCWKLASR